METKIVKIGSTDKWLKKICITKRTERMKIGSGRKNNAELSHRGGGGGGPHCCVVVCFYCIRSKLMCA